MECKIDWLSFTVPLVSGLENGDSETARFLLSSLRSYVGASALNALSFDVENPVPAHGFYSHSCVDRVTGARFSWGPVNAHIYVEFTGVACAALAACETWHDMLAVVQPRVSRIDLACDIETDVEPAVFLKFATLGRSVSHASITSPEGLTEYIGSRKSDRFMRVYRFAEPHPRANLLRIEHEFKGDLAKVVASQIVTVGVVATFLKACNTYMFSHPDWKPETAIEGLITSVRERRDKAGTILWLTTQVAPALARAQREGVIDIDEWIDHKVRPLV